MVAKYGKHVAKAGPTPQTAPIPGRESEQVVNSAGGYVFAVDDWTRLDRFLILGSEGGTYYVGEHELTIKNAQAVMRCIDLDGSRVVSRVVEISSEGRAPKNDPALFVLALCAAAKDMKTRQLATAALPLVARIGTHLFHFAEYVQAQRGWGPTLKRAVGNWYNDMSIDRLTEMVLKYQSRDGWSNRDLLRLAHPKTTDETRNAIYKWVTKGSETPVATERLAAYEALKAEPTAKNAINAINKHKFTREMIPTELLNDVDVWEALFVDMPMTAMIRNLGKMSSVGLLKPLSVEAMTAAERLGNVELLRKARIHPMAVLLALKTYSNGKGDRGKLTWSPVPQIVDALDSAFELAFKTVVPTGKRILIGIDVSASMSADFMNSPLEVCEAAAAMAMVTARTEQNYHICAFDTGMRKLPITAKTSLKGVLKHTKDINGGGTDCAMPMIWANTNKLDVDAFLVLTDNETWAGRGGHPSQALQDYRNKTGIPAKLTVCGMTSTGFTIADPKDAGMMDVVGFDTATPSIIADFIRT